jgi:hypothetical protein
MWVADSESDGFVEEATKLHCFVAKVHKKDHYRVFCNKDELPTDFIAQVSLKYNIAWKELSELGEFLRESKALVIHNLFGHDLPLFEKLGYIKTYDMCPEHIDGEPVRLIDSLSMSRCLHPDRLLPKECPTHMYNTVTGKLDKVGPHGLAAWGYRVANKKPTVDDWRGQPLDVYVERCIEDVVINDLALIEMIKESKELASGGDWRAPLKINNKSDFLMDLQERDGILFDVEAAVKLRDRIDVMMTEIAEDVEPQLPERTLPKSKQPSFPSEPFAKGGGLSHHGWNYAENVLGYNINREVLNIVAPPKTAFKKDGTLSVAGVNYCLKHEIEGDDNQKAYIQKVLKEVNTGKVLPDDEMAKLIQELKDKKCVILKEPMRLSNQQDIKEYLFNIEGWRPTLWRVKDVSRDKNKQPFNENIIVGKIKEYIEATKTSIYKELVYKEMGCNFERDKPDKVMELLQRKARFLVTSPKLKDERGELCASLSRLKGEMAKQIVKWLSLRNRRSVIQTSDPKKDTGWLNNKRLKVDGRIGQGHSGPTNTNRYKHRNIVNLPKASDDVLLGKEMRSLFIAPEGYKILGYDGSNLEQFVAASYAYKYDNGDYADKIAGDSHATNAKAYSIAAGRKVGRGEGKGITYATLYGAGAAKIAAMLGISLAKGKAVIAAFWDTNIGLKLLKENLERYWEKQGNKQYIRGIDGRKVYTRSKSSLVNALFQSCGSIIMFLSGLYMYDSLCAEGLIGNGIKRLAFVHDEYQYEVSEDLIDTYTFHTKEEAESFTLPDKLLSNPREISEGKWERYYCIVGELGDMSLRKAGKFFDLPLEFSAAYDIGNNLAETH